jgi:hypothetical protein
MTDPLLPGGAEIAMVRRILPLAMLAFLTLPVSTLAQDDGARGVILRAQEAHGGKERLQKYPAKRTKYKAAFFADRDFDVTGDLAIQFAVRMKHSLTLASTKTDMIFDGKDLWSVFMGATQRESEAAQIDSVQAALYIDAVLQLADLHGEGYKLTALGESKVRGEPAVGLRVAKAGKPDVDLWFSKKSQLLMKSEFDGYHPLTLFLGASRKTKHELYFSGYKSVAGIQTPERIEIINQLARMRVEVTETRYFERFDDNFFAPP